STTRPPRRREPESAPPATAAPWAGPSSSGATSRTSTPTYSTRTDPMTTDKRPAVTTTFYSARNAALKAAANQRLATLANYVFGEGFLPDVAATASGYKNRETAYRAAKNA